ncbi:protocadherin Fat 2 isoform X1, partial [Argonauta hians]
GNAEHHNITLAPSNYSSFFSFDPVTRDLVTSRDFSPGLVPGHVVLVVSVTDVGGLSDTTLVDVKVEWSNRAPVLGTALPTSVLVPENTPNNTEVYRLEVIDPDVTDDLVYRVNFLTPGATSKFYFNQTTGGVYVSGNLDYEMLTAKQFTISMSANDGRLSSPSHNLTIVITDTNEPPYFTASVFYVKILEGMERSVLTNVLALNTVEPDRGDTTRYKLDKGSNHSLFAINSTTGVVYFAVDYTTATMPKSVSLDVTAYDSAGLSCTARLDVDIGTVNRAPKITNVPQTLYVREETSPGTLLFQVDAYDADRDAVLFSLVYFPARGAVWFHFDDTSGKLFTASDQTINYEAMPDVSFELCISASDGKSQSETANLTVHIVDINEAPHFYSRLYFVDVLESKGGTVLPMYVQFKVIDPDVNDTYHFSMMTADNSSWFSIDPISGNISFAVDYNVRVHPSNIFLVVAVKDRHNLQDTTLVNVTVHSVNNVPTIVHLPPVISLPEDHPPLQEVLAIQVIDPDPWDVFTYKIHISPPEGITLFDLNRTSGLLYVSDGLQLDYEAATSKSYHLTFVVSDGHVDSSPSEVTINVIDVNEPPEFTDSIYYISAYEGSPGTVLEESHVIKAYDQDANDSVTYTIGSTDGNATMFTINRTSGLLSFAVNYDCTMMPHYVTLWATARDSKGLRVRAEVRVVISHLNRVPVVQNLPATIRVSESVAPRRLLLYTLLLHDPDPSDPAFFVATFTPAFGLDTFHVDTASGAITLREDQRLNHEFCEEYVLTITVYDGHNHSVPENLTILIEDVNEAPYFLMSRYYITAAEGPASTVLPDPSLEVRDPDDNDSVTFSLEGNKHSQRFEIHPRTGRLRFAVDYDIDRNTMASRETIKIKAKDKGGLEATTEVQINIIDMNDNAPVFNQSGYTIFVRLSDPIGYKYLTVYATDIDQNLNAEIRYGIDDFKNLKYFGITETGDIYLQKPLRFEKLGDMRVLVTATDKGTPSQSSVAMVTVIVEGLPTNVTYYMDNGNDSVTPQLMVNRAGHTTPVEDLSTFGVILFLLNFVQVIGVCLVYRWLAKRCQSQSRKNNKQEIEHKINCKNEVAPEEEDIASRNNPHYLPQPQPPPPPPAEVKNESDAKKEPEVTKRRLSKQGLKSEEKTQETENSSRFEFWNNGGSDQSGEESSSGDATPAPAVRQYAHNTEKGCITPVDNETKRPARREIRRDNRVITPSFGQLQRESILNAWLNC